MSTHTITITHTLTDEFLQDIMTTAVESSYEWFAFRRVMRLPEGHEHHLNITSFDAYEVDCDDGGDVLSTTPINAAKIAEALQKIISGSKTNEAGVTIGYVHAVHVATISGACAENDASNIDMDVADCILQVACFDELRYG